MAYASCEFIRINNTMIPLFANPRLAGYCIYQNLLL